MRPLALLAFCIRLAAAEETTAVTAAIPGVRPVTILTTSAAGTTAIVKTTQNLNGREVPVEETVETILSQTPEVTVIERRVRRYTPGGAPGPGEMARVEIRREAGGAVHRTETVWAEDINGRRQLRERVTSTERRSGAGKTTQVQVERPTLNGTAAIVQRRSIVEQNDPDGFSATAVTEERDANGRFRPVRRVLTSARETAGTKTVSTEELTDSGNGWRPVQKTVETTSANGTVIRDIYESALPGRTSDNGFVRTRQQIVERTPAPGGTLEVISARPVDPDNPGRFGPLREVERRVCTGNCQNGHQP